LLHYYSTILISDFSVLTIYVHIFEGI